MVSDSLTTAAQHITWQCSWLNEWVNVWANVGSPDISHTVPVQSLLMCMPSANGIWNGMWGVSTKMMGVQPGQFGSMNLSPYLQHRPSPNLQEQLQPTLSHLSPTPPITPASENGGWFSGWVLGSNGSDVVHMWMCECFVMASFWSILSLA
jgi:hypothetical protein